jgi:hypothetical protein
MTFHTACRQCLLQHIAGVPERAGSVREMNRSSTLTKRCQFGFNQVQDVRSAGTIEPRLNRHLRLKFRNTSGEKEVEIVKGSRMHLVQLLLHVADKCRPVIPRVLV